MTYEPKSITPGSYLLRKLIKGDNYQYATRLGGITRDYCIETFHLSTFSNIKLAKVTNIDYNGTIFELKTEDDTWWLPSSMLIKNVKVRRVK